MGDDLHTSRRELDARELRETLDFLREGIQILSPVWRYVYINDAVAVHGRRSREELLGKTMFECYPGIEDTAVFKVLEVCMRERRSDHVENEFQYDGGERAWFELRIQPCTEGLIVLSLDITERKRLEASLRQDDKLRALGQMAAGIAHDLKNILNPIALQLQLLRAHIVSDGGGSASASRTVGDGSTYEALATIEQAIRAGTDTVENLRRFSRKETDGAPERTDLNRSTDVAVEICRPKTHERPGVRIIRQGGAVPQILVRGSELVTAIVNLVVNAIEALPAEGTITVRTGSDGGAWVEIADDGPGMPPEVEARIFEPFFTTKPQGTGLGLATVYAFVQRHGGGITVDTAPGRGTAIRMRFPAAPALERARPIAVARPASSRLLLVEDDPASRKALQMLLEDEGFTVETRSTGEDALAALQTYEADALVIDFRLPGMDGVMLARAAREHAASLPVVIMSGFDRTHSAFAALLRSPRTEHVSKPIDVDVLVEVLHRIFEPPDPGLQVAR